MDINKIFTRLIQLKLSMISLILLFILAFLTPTNAEAIDCQTAVMEALLTKDQGSQLVIAVASGKWVNDLGQYDMCTQNPGTIYATISLPPAPIFLGVCLPTECNSKNSKIIKDTISYFSASMGIALKGQINFPEREQPFFPDTLRIIGFMLFGLLFLICIFGMIVEYTNLFGCPVYEEINKNNDNKRDKELTNSKSTIGKLLLAFSFSRNLKKMFWSSQKDDDYLTIFNGLRVISMAYILFGHIHWFIQGVPVSNQQGAKDILTSLYGNLVMGGFYAVDVFFFMSAFLGAFLMIPKLKKLNPVVLVMIYFHRFFRILPTLGLFTALFLTFFVYLGDGPIWHLVYNVFVQPCQKYWWTNMLFITNFYPPEGTNGCMGFLWYLSNDMIFFMILPLVIFTYCANKMIGYIFTLFLISANIVVSFIVSELGDHPVTIMKDPNNVQIYRMPWVRSGAYFVGCLFGIMYYEWNQSRTDYNYRSLPGAKFYISVYKNKILRLFLQVFSAGVMIFLIFIIHCETREPVDIVWPQMLSNFFNAFHRVIFVLALALFLSGPLVGKSRLTRFILGGSFWAPWAKITFIVYLLHISVIVWFYAQARQAIFLTQRVAIFLFFSSLVLSFLVAIPVTLLIESPVTQLEKLLLFPPKQRIDEVKKDMDILEQKIMEKIQDSDSETDESN